MKNTNDDALEALQDGKHEQYLLSDTIEIINIILNLLN